MFAGDFETVVHFADVVHFFLEIADISLLFFGVNFGIGAVCLVEKLGVWFCFFVISVAFVFVVGYFCHRSVGWGMSVFDTIIGEIEKGEIVY